jgi:Glycosyl hydrolases family 18
MPAGPMRVNAWLFLNEDEPSGAGYDTPGSSWNRLITEGVYRSVDTLFIAFVDTVPTSATTVPSGDGTSWTLANGAVDHPGGETNADYMRLVVADAREQNPDIRILTTLQYGEGDVLSRVLDGPGSPEEQAAAFAGNVVQFLRHWGLDGFDVDWESPLSDGTSQEQFALIFSALGAAFRTQGPVFDLTLSPAVASNLDGPTVNENITYLNLQLYSGFTEPGDFTGIGIRQDLLAYGAKFESGYQTAAEAHQAATAGGYSVITQWRLNSDNFVFEQDQQVTLHRLASS